MTNSDMYTEMYMWGGNRLAFKVAGSYDVRELLYVDENVPELP